MEGLTLFNTDLEQKNQELDETQIRQFILYFSEDELKEMKRLVKRGCLVEFNEDRFSMGNASDLILIALRKQYTE
tara:strand:+ start:345 stop:569 length:225 start_codon:yes stop_codon:yes gene_type:complete